MPVLSTLSRFAAVRRPPRAAIRFAALTVALGVAAQSGAAQTTGGTRPPTGAGGHAGHAGHAAQPGAESARAHGKASHGGQVLMVGQRHVELVATPDGVLSVWLTDRVQGPLPAPSGASVVLTSGADVVTLPLAPDAAGQYLTARYDAATYRSFEAVLRLPVEGGEPGAVRSVRFTVPAPR